MRYLLTLCCALLLLPGCAGVESTSSTLADTSLVVRTGTSFGMCLGYCESTLEIGGTEMILRQTSREPDRNPPREVRGTLTRQQWEEIAALASSDAFARLDETYGCPDCADGGAEFIEVERDGRKQRVNFEYGASVDGIAPLIARLRALREQLEPK
jgi:hypothetical protein